MRAGRTSSSKPGRFARRVRRAMATAVCFVLVASNLVGASATRTGTERAVSPFETPTRTLGSDLLGGARAVASAAGRLLTSATAFAAAAPAAAAVVVECAPPAGVIISEFRLRGPAGPEDEFVELYNSNSAPVKVCTADGSDGWALASSDGVARFTVPNGTTIPALGHFLAVGSAYSLAGSAKGNLSYSSGIPDDTGLALFNTGNPASLTSANRLDAVGFTTTANTLYREGAGLAPVGSGNVEHSFYRKLHSGLPQDTGSNAADFMLISATAGLGDTLTKTAAEGWNSGASSAQAIASGDGYFEFTAPNVSARMAGLSNGDSNQSHTDIDFAIHANAGGMIDIWEAGTFKWGGVYSYQAGDRFRVAVEGGVVKYYKLSGGQTTHLYTSSVAPTYPLLADTSFYYTGAQISRAFITGGPAAGLTWRDVVGLSASHDGVQWTLGTPGPENLSSPTLHNASLKSSLIDPAASSAAAPNRVRDMTPYVDAQSGTFNRGTFVFRRRYTNSTGEPVTRLRFKMVDITTYPVPAGTADLRAISSVDVMATKSDGTQVLVRGTTLETPPAQPAAGGHNSTLAAGSVSMAEPLAPGASIDLQWVLGVVQGGGFRFFINVEAMRPSVLGSANQTPVANAGGPYTGTPETPIQFNGTASSDPDGSVVTHRWEFDGMNLSWGATPTHVYPGAGTYAAKLTVFDDKGASSASTTTVTISRPPPPSPPGDQLIVEPGDDSGWTPGNRPSADDVDNGRGAPPNRPEGNANFQLAAPIASLPGRGMNLDLNLVYNSLMWNKSGTEMFYDIDHDWPAPGWQFGFGKMISMGTAGAMIIDADGTRHGFKGRYDPSLSTTPVFTGQTTDGSFIEYRCEMSEIEPRGVARFPNGTVVHYSNFSRNSYRNKAQRISYMLPTNIVDANGNYITIRYDWDDNGGGRIKWIVDTMGRVIRFHYSAEGLLTAITAPGLADANGASAPRTLARFNYERESVMVENAFAGLTPRVRDRSPWMLKAIYYPATKTGYWFGDTDSYSLYGMLRKVEEQRAMGFPATTPLDQQGVISEGTLMRKQEYDYESGPSLSKAPTYRNVTETVEATGGEPQTAVTSISVETQPALDQRVVTITRPDTTKAIQRAHSFPNRPDTDPNKFLDGLVKEEETLSSTGASLGKVKHFWQPGHENTPRLQRTETVDELGQTLKVEYDQYGAYNAVGVVREFGYDGAPLRSTVKTYLHYADDSIGFWMQPQPANSPLVYKFKTPRLLGLVQTEKVYDGAEAAGKLAAFTEYKYDEYASPLQAVKINYKADADLWFYGEIMRPDAGIIHHSGFFNPMSWEAGNGAAGENYVKLRGNVTTAVSYADLSAPSQPSGEVREARTYDMAGNGIAKSTACCEKTVLEFAELTQYAFPSSQTRGSAGTTAADELLKVTTTMVYDFNTGLPRSATDANGRKTETTYHAESLRPKEIVLPSGGLTAFAYDDAELKTTQTSYLARGGAVIAESVKYLNGRGQVRQTNVRAASDTWDVVETVYDIMGRPWKQTLPYRAVGGTTPPEKWWKETVYDDAGRVAAVREPGFNPLTSSSNSAVTVSYNQPTRPLGASAVAGQSTMTTDAWGRWKWARLDALGRLVEVVEHHPDAPIGKGSEAVSGLVTSYGYDALGRLARVEQEGQVRRFRHDALGRLTHQKLAEAEATLNSSGERATTESAEERWSDVFAYDERSNMIWRTDARGVRTNYAYGNDPLNRLQGVSYDPTRVSAGGPTVLPAPNVTYAYRRKTSGSDKVNITQLESVTLRQANAQQNTGVETYKYDAAGRIEWKSVAIPGRPEFKINYGYDTLDRVQELTYPAQYASGVPSPARKVVKQVYGTAGRLEALRVNTLGGAGADADYASGMVYNSAGRVRSINVGSGAGQVVETFDYDPRNNFLISQKVARGSATLAGYEYDYSQDRCTSSSDCRGQRTSYTGQITQIKDTVSGKLTFYSYDSLGRLKHAQRGAVEMVKLSPAYKPHWVQNYSYDKFGNRTAVVATTYSDPVPADGLPSLAYDPATNRVTTQGFVYDAAGNQTQNGTGQELVYDAAGRLAQVKTSSGVVATYTYNEANQRLITHHGDETSARKTFYVWGGGSVIAEYDESAAAPSSPQWAKNFIYMGGRLLATQKPAAGGEVVNYHHPDQLSTRVITSPTDAAGSVTATQEALPFGTVLSTAGPEDATGRRFTTYERSLTTGLDYAVNRHYDPRQGRFTQVDPIGIRAANPAAPQTWNMYSYCGNDPINNADPDGLFIGSILRWAGRFLVGLFGGPGGVNVNASFAYKNLPPISVSASNNFQNVNFSFAGVTFAKLGAAQPQQGRHPSPKGFPCPPSIGEIFTGRGKGYGAVKELLGAVWDLAVETNREEGGWIYMNRKGVLKGVIKQWGREEDFQTQITLDDPLVMPGWIVIATFHTHDFGSQPSQFIPMGTSKDGRKYGIPGDDTTNAQQRVPGIILGGTHTPPAAYTPYGPTRGYWYSDLPKRCQ